MSTRLSCLVLVALSLYVAPAPLAAAGASTLPFDDPATALDLRLGSRIAELGEELRTLQEGIARLESSAQIPWAETLVGAPRGRSEALLRLHARLEAWNSIAIPGQTTKREARLLSLLYQLRHEGRVLEALLSRQLGKPLTESSALFAPPRTSLRNGGGSFSGSVTTQQNGTPLEGVSIEIFDATGEWTSSVTTAGDGSFTSPSLPAGTYFAHTVELTSGYVNELYDGTPCSFICDVTGGTAIPVSDSSNTSGVDFVLALGGRISGTAADADSEAALPAIIIDLFDSSGRWVSNPATGDSGSFLSPGLEAGSYYATTYNEDRYLDQRYDGQACPFDCEPTGGTAIEVTLGSTTGGIDFDLTKGGAVTGTVSEVGSAASISGVWVDLYDDQGHHLTSAQTGGAGVYLTGRGLPTGGYRARTTNSLGYVDELFAEQTCLGWCDVTGGNPISVTEGATTLGIDFTLGTGGSISGTVIEEGTGLAIADVWVDVFDDQQRFVASDATNESGEYQLLTGLPPGSYFARTVSPARYVDELYDDQTCPTWCNVTDGSAIEVLGTGTTSGIDFVLGRGGLIAGSVEGDGGLPLAGVMVDVFTLEGAHVAYGESDTQGAWTTYSTLPEGNYYARTWNELGYIDELYRDLPCPGGGCDVTAGRPILVLSTATTTGIRFGLTPGWSISGRVTERTGSAPIENVSVEIRDQEGDWLGNAWTDEAGDYRSPALAAGTYYLKSWNDQGYVDQLHSELPCLGCLATAGQPVVVPGTSEVDFALARSGGISGTVTAENGGSPIADVHVEAWSDTGRLLGWQGTDGSGEYTLAGLPAGDFFVKTWNEAGYVNESWRDRPCSVCSPTDGSRVRVTAGATTAGIDFDLELGGSVSGMVSIDELAIVNRIVVQIHDSEGWVASGRPVADGSYTVGGLRSGNYFARTGNGAGYLNEVWNDLPCIGSCEVTAGTPIPVVAGAATPGIDFALEPGGRIAGRVIDQDSGLPIDDSEVHIFDASGVRLIGARVGADGRYRTWASLPPPGPYFAASGNWAGFFDEIYPGIACPGGGEFCAVTSGVPIMVEAGSVLEGIDFSLASGGGWIEGSIVDEEWATGLSGIDVDLFDSSGRQATRITWQRPLEGTGRFQSCGLPAGTYFARTDSSSLLVPLSDEIYDGLPCRGDCDATSGTPIAVSAGVGRRVDFRLGSTSIFFDGFESGTTGEWSSSLGEVQP